MIATRYISRIKLIGRIIMEYTNNNYNLMARIVGEFVNVAILRACPVEFLRFRRASKKANRLKLID